MGNIFEAKSKFFFNPRSKYKRTNNNVGHRITSGTRKKKFKQHCARL
jgi:hypothetical protein